MSDRRTFGESESRWMHWKNFCAAISLSTRCSPLSFFFVPHEPARFVGLENEMIASYRIDNLAGVHAAFLLIGFLEKPSAAYACKWPYSGTMKRSARAPKKAQLPHFLNDILERIAFSLKIDPEELLLLKNNSLCVSIDMAHALNPNYPKKHDPHHTPLLGKGIVLKHNADQKYASNALSAAVIVHACQSAQSALSILCLPIRYALRQHCGAHRRCKDRHQHRRHRLSSALDAFDPRSDGRQRLSRYGQACSPTYLQEG